MTTDEGGRATAIDQVVLRQQRDPHIVGRGRVQRGLIASAFAGGRWSAVGRRNSR